MARNAAICLLLAALSCADYVQALGFDFVNYDDPTYVTDNPKIAAGLTRDGVAWVFTNAHGANWHPLTGIAHMLDVELFGLDPAGHHGTNVLFHLLNTLLLFGLLVSMTAAPWKSALVAALFAVHPLHVESVAWVSERKDVLSTFFWLLATWAYAAYARRGGVLRYGLVAILFALALMAKPMAVTLPFTLLLLDWWPLGRVRLGTAPAPAAAALAPPRLGIGRLLAEKAPLLLLSAAASAATVIFQKGAGSMVALDELSLPARAANALVSLAAYIGGLFWPAGLSVRYPHPDLPGGTPWEWWQVAGAAAVVLGAFALAVRFARRGYPLTGWLWFAGTLVPVLGLVQVGDSARADRYTYVPAIGLFVVIAWSLAEIAERLRAPRTALAAAAAASVLALTAAAHVHARHFRDSIALAERALAVTDGNFLMHNNLGNALADQGRHDEALAQYREALRIHPACVEALNNVGTILVESGRLSEAEGCFSQALRLDPEHYDAQVNMGLVMLEQKRFDRAAHHYGEALRLRPGRAAVQTNLGVALAALGRHGEAAGWFREALRGEPNLPQAHFSLGKLMLEARNLPEATRSLSRALALDPNYAQAHNSLGVALAMQGRVAEAQSHLEAALRLDPDLAEAYANLGLLAAGRGDHAQAIGHYERALERDPRLGEAHFNLGNSLDALGRSEQALAHFRTALEIEPRNANARFNMGNVLAKLGRLEEAAAQYAEVLRLAPGHAAARHNLERVRAEMADDG